MFSDDDKRVYKYSTGAEERYADPLMVEQEVSRQLGGDINRIVNDINAGPPASAEALALLCGAVRQAFGLVPFDPQTGSGLTAREVLALWNDFCAWGEKKNRTSAA